MIAILGNGFIAQCLSLQTGATTIPRNQMVFPAIKTLFVCAPTGNRIVVRQNSDKDLLDVADIVSKINLIKPARCILIGTVDSLLNSDHPYSVNRRRLEELHNFDLIVRLPNLIHQNIQKKNLLWDLKNKKWLDSHNLNSIQQWYNLEHLYKDIQTIEKLEYQQYNLVSVPIANRYVVEEFFPELLPKLVDSNQNIVHYNIHNDGKYHYTLQDIHSSMTDYLRRPDGH
jgi:hypothetical protein